MLLKMGCRYGQGFLFGHPEPASHTPPRTARPDASPDRLAICSS